LRRAGANLKPAFARRNCTPAQFRLTSRMDFWNRMVFGVCAACLSVTLAGCEPSGQSAADDEKEPHFVLGQNRVNAMDYAGAVEAFEESLEANPHSAPAHYQLAMLYSEKESNPAAAIYHYQQYLRFDPKASNADIVNQHIATCKQQLATDVLQLPSSPAAQQQLQQLADKNRQLQDEVDKWRAYYAGQMAVVKTNQLPAAGKVALSAPAAASSLANPATPAPPVGKTRTHIVAAGETPAAIARKAGVSLNALLAANPGLNPKKLHAGQSINLPPP
jgi:LysM repeat protein